MEVEKNAERLNQILEYWDYLFALNSLLKVTDGYSKWPYLDWRESPMNMYRDCVCFVSANQNDPSDFKNCPALWSYSRSSLMKYLRMHVVSHFSLCVSTHAWLNLSIWSWSHWLLHWINPFWCSPYW